MANIRLTMSKLRGISEEESEEMEFSPSANKPSN